MDITERIHNAIEWANKRLTLQGQELSQEQKNYLTFALSQNFTDNTQAPQLPQTAVKSRFFAQYYGQEILRWHQWIETTPDSKVDLSIPEIEKSGWFIKLKPLSKITNEDAEKLQYTLVNVVGLDGLIRKNSIELVKEVVSNYEQIDCLFMLPSSFTDLARELGYAIDWNNHKVSKQIELGWVQLL